MRIAVRQQRVRGLHNQRAHGIRFASLHGMQHEIGVCRRKVALRKHLAINALGELANELEAGVALQRRAIGAQRVQAARTMLRRQVVGHFQINFGHEIALVHNHTRAGLIQVAGNGAQAANCTMTRGNIASHLVNAAPGNKGRSASIRKRTSCEINVIFGNTAARRSNGWRERLHVPRQLIKTMTPRFNELVVV